VHHHPGPGKPLLYGSGGPVTYIAGHRTGLLLAQHPSDEDIRILATIKNNFSAKACNLIYRIVSNSSGIPTIRWLGANYTSTASLLKDSTHHLRYSPERQALLKILRTSPVPLSPKELAIQTCQDYTLVKQMLRRMFKADEILYPAYGLYTSHDLPLIEGPISENATIIPTTLATTDPDLDQPITTDTPTTLATPATDPAPDQPTTTDTPATLATPATDSDLDQPITPTTLVTLNLPASNVALPANAPEHNTLITPPTPTVFPIPLHEKTPTPPPSFEISIESIRNLLRCSYKDHHLHWIFSTNKAGCPICDIWINNDTNLNPDLRILYDTLAQHPPRPGESNPAWLHRILPLL
jgi:hypothetical protein